MSNCLIAPHRELWRQVFGDHGLLAAASRRRRPAVNDNFLLSVAASSCSQRMRLSSSTQSSLRCSRALIAEATITMMNCNVTCNINVSLLTRSPRSKLPSSGIQWQNCDDGFRDRTGYRTPRDAKSIVDSSTQRPQKATKRSSPDEGVRPSMDVKTFLPKWNDSPQSK